MRTLQEIDDETLQQAIEIRFSGHGKAIVMANAIGGATRGDVIDVAIDYTPVELYGECVRRGADATAWVAACTDTRVVDTELWSTCAAADRQRSAG